eukprot:TRINITY_DN7472_c0_g1_i4.p1 TRINITY_DN7472_c0_g1~~TRINITY_DN7472_c0_g1_i4.p1  ORF type:complete len:104 (+),score=20.08 TRINITY_DN7472_c0_g1_i4:280-591(+)
MNGRLNPIRNAPALRALYISTFCIFFFPILAVQVICRTNLIYAEDVRIEDRIVFAGFVALGLVMTVMIGIVVAALVEQEPDWAKKKDQPTVNVKKNTKKKKSS